MRALLGLLRKEVYHIRRDPRTLAVLLALPVIQVVLFGSAIRTDVDRVRLAIVDPAPDRSTLALRARFAAAGVFDIVAVAPRTSDLDRLFQQGAAQQAVVFAPGFARDLAAGRPAELLLVTDGTEPNTASLVQAYAQAVVASYERELGPRPAGATLRQAPVRLVTHTRMQFNPTRESAHLFVPGLMAFVLTIISSLMTAISLAREKETGTLEALLVSPLRPWSIVVGKVLPYLAIGVVAALAIVAEARLVFGVPLRGSLVLLVAEAVLFILASLALGILVSSRTSSQRVAMMGAMLGTMLPNILLSGFIFPVESMPLPLQLLSNLVAGRWFVEIARGIMLKGVGLEYLWPQTLVLAGMAVLLLGASARAFRARLE